MLALVHILVFLFTYGDNARSISVSVVGILIALPYALFSALPAYLVVSLPWWYRVNRELRDLDRSYGTGKTSRWLVVLLPYVAVFRVVRDIQRAQSRAGQPVISWSPWMLAPGLVAAPALFACLQHELNKIWAVEGKPLDPWPADSSPKANWSTATLPWVKAKRPKP